MQHPSRWIVLSFALAACSQGTPDARAADAEPGPAVAAAAAQDPIAVAMSGAPAAIGRDATIMRMTADGGLEELRAGTNGWLCIPDDNPAAPGNAPMCMDEHWQVWMAAFMAGETPSITGIGTSYMLQGGYFASNSDPSIQTPAEGDDWLFDGPHLMMVVPDPAMLEGYPTEHGTGGPYVMWAGTPYAHLMIPTGER